MFDLASLDTRTASERGVAMPVIHPRTRAPIANEAGKTVSITLLGRCSDTYRDTQRTLAERAAENLARGIRQTAEEQEAQNVELLCACTKDWTFDTLDGAEFPCTAENIRRLWTDRRFLWLRDQAVVHIQSDGNFLPA